MNRSIEVKQSDNTGPEEVAVKLIAGRTAIGRPPAGFEYHPAPQDPTIGEELGSMPKTEES